MSPPILRTARAGFTLLEVMIAVSLVAILIGIAAPSIKDFLSEVRLTGHANDLITDLMLARSEAVKRDVSMTVCGKKNNADTVCGNDPNWAGGWLVVLDADRDGKQDTGVNTLLKTMQEGATGKVTVVNKGTGGNKGVITYTPTGISATGYSDLRFCDSDRPGFGRRLEVSQQGRASVTKISPQLNNANLCS
jgi:type IV fimbrial biogenesis protein FimT